MTPWTLNTATCRRRMLTVNLQAPLDMCLAVITRIGESYYGGQTRDEFVASRPTREFDAQWGDPTLFLQTAYTGAWSHVNEIRRITR
jgi:hypothetical protein